MTPSPFLYEVVGPSRGLFLHQIFFRNWLEIPKPPPLILESLGICMLRRASVVPCHGPTDLLGCSDPNQCSHLKCSLSPSFATTPQLISPSSSWNAPSVGRGSLTTQLKRTSSFSWLPCPLKSHWIRPFITLKTPLTPFTEILADLPSPFSGFFIFTSLAKWLGHLVSFLSLITIYILIIL